MLNNHAYIIDCVRTPRGKGKKNGALYEVRPIELLKTVLQAIQNRNNLDTKEVNDLILGCVTPIGEQGADIAKIGLLYANWNQDVPGTQINRFCASGLEAINLAAAKIASGYDDLVAAGGLESMSRIPMGADGGAWISDPAVNSKLGFVPQGISADLIATREGFSRNCLDNYALTSQQRAAFAIKNNYFKHSIIPVCDINNIPILSTDEYPRPHSTLEELLTLTPSFAAIGALGFDAVALKHYPEIEEINHVHTAGNSSGIVDGAAMTLLASKNKAMQLGLKPRAKILACAAIGSEPTIMLQGPAPAAKLALKKAGMTTNNIDLWEMNEAFAAAVLKFKNDMNIDMEKLNVNGGAIALGHPLGATGAMLIGTVLDELERQNLETALVTLCVGGGMGVATIIERV